MKKILLFLPILVLWSCTSEVDDAVESIETVEDTFEGKPFSAYGPHKMFWNFEEDFPEEHEQKMIEWMENIADATTRTIGQYPFDVDVTFHYSERGNPVSFGHTDRKQEIEGLHLYVNADASMDELLADWTAPHEFAHLSLPFSGKKNRWFSEGYATYLSRQILVEMGEMTNEEFDSMYTARIHETMYAYGSCTMTHLEVTDSLLEDYHYGDMYWGSSSFFFTVDKVLEENHDMRFIDLVKKYQNNGRMEDKSLKSVIASYDEIIGDDICTNLMRKYREEPSCVAMEGY